MTRVYASNYYELRQKYPSAFAIKQERGGRWSGVIVTRKSNEANASRRN